MFDPAVPPPARFGFLLLPNYSMIAFANAVEVLRMANRIAGKPLYAWHVCGADGATASSSGLTVRADATLADLDRCELVLVCGGLQVRAATTEAVREDLRRRARRGQHLGALCTGTYALASAGLLNGYRCAIHWENHAAIREEFPGVHFALEIFLVDRDRCTASGGTAPLHMMLHLVSLRHGRRLAMAISEQFIVDRVRTCDDRQRLPQPECIGPGYQHLVSATEIMAANIEDPLPLADVAAAVGVSLRHLERLFLRYHDTGPAQYYMNVRLQRARELLSNTALRIMEVTVACGFQSPSHFCKAYRSQFGQSPRETRRREPAAIAARPCMRPADAIAA